MLLEFFQWLGGSTLARAVAHRILDIKVDLKPIAESNLFDFHIGLQKEISSLMS